MQGRSCGNRCRSNGQSLPSSTSPVNKGIREEGRVSCFVIGGRVWFVYVNKGIREDRKRVSDALIPRSHAWQICDHHLCF